MLVSKIDHCAVYVSDLGRSVTYYEELLGVRASYVGDTGGLIPGAFIVVGDTILALLTDTRTATEAYPWPQHLAFAVEDVDAVYADLVARGYRPVAPPENLPTGFVLGQRSIDLMDPDGVDIEFVQRTPCDAAFWERVAQPQTAP